MIAASGPRLAAGLILAAVGGWVFDRLGMPLGWILGAMAGAAIFTNVAGPAPGVKGFRRGGQLLLGGATGGVLTPDVMATMLGLLPAMVLSAAAANVAGVALSYPLARIARVDRTTALLSALPAGMAEMASLATEVKARAEVVTVVHTLRVVLVVVSVPLILHLPEIVPQARAEVPGASYAALMACLVVGGLLAATASRLGILNPWIIMPMATAVAFVAVGLPIKPMPVPFVVLAQLLIGYALGCRLRASDLGRLPRAAAAALVTGGALITVMAWGAASLLGAWTGVERITLVLGTAPGGLGEMIASAEALGAGTALVAGFQFLRSFLTNMIVPPLILRWTGRGS